MIDNKVKKIKINSNFGQIRFESFEDYINNINPIFKDIIFDFWICFCGTASLCHPVIREQLINFVGTFGSFAEAFDKKYNLKFKIDSNKFESNVELGELMKCKTNSLLVEIYEQLKRKKLLDKLKIKNKELFFFIRHLRNAAAHDNIFDLKNKDDTWRNDLNCHWRSLAIGKDLEKKNLHDFINFSQVFILIQDISALLKNR